MGLDGRIRRRLKLRDLDTFLAVVQSGSMAKAAARLAVSQPAVSKAIAEMEHTLGVRVLDRTAQGVEPTMYGQTLVKWAAVIFDDVAQGIKEIEYLVDPTAGELHIGASEPMIGGFLAAVLSRLYMQFPRIKSQVSVSTLSTAYRDLRERRMDLYIGRTAAERQDEDVETKPLFQDPIRVCSAVVNPLTRRRRVRLAELRELPWVLPSEGTVPRDEIARAFQQERLAAPDAIVGCNSIQMQYALLAHGFLTVMPRSLLTFSPMRTSVKVLPIALASKPPPVGIVTLKNRMISPVAQVFIEQAREVAKTLM